MAFSGRKVSKIHQVVARCLIIEVNRAQSSGKIRILKRSGLSLHPARDPSSPPAPLPKALVTLHWRVVHARAAAARPG